MSFYLPAEDMLATLTEDSTYHACTGGPAEDSTCHTRAGPAKCNITPLPVWVKAALATPMMVWLRTQSVTPLFVLLSIIPIISQLAEQWLRTLPVIPV